MRSVTRFSEWQAGLRLSRLALVFALGGVALTVAVAGYVYFQTEMSEQRAAATEASVFADSLAQRTRIGQAFLRAVAARVRDTDLRVTEFDDFVASLGPEPALEGLAWLPRVAGGDRGLFERRARQQGSVGYAILDRSPQGDLVRADDREDYFPIRFAAGAAAMREAIGLDLAQEPGYDDIIALALREGRTAATWPSTLETGQPGFLIVEPVVRAEGRSRTLTGLVAAMFRLDLLAAAASPAPLIARDVVILDLDSDRPPIAIRTPDGTVSDHSGWPFKDIAIGGRPWRVFLEPPDGRALEQALIVMLIGFALTGLTTVLADRNQQGLIAQDLRREVARQTAALQRSTAEFRALFEEGGTGKCELVPQSRHFRRVNRRLGEMLGRSQDELLGLALDDVLHPNDRIGDEGDYAALLDGQSDAYFAEKRFLHADGSELWCEIHATVLRDDAGRPVWTVAVIQDIARRKQAEDVRQLLVRELAHRVKNMLQVARSLADQTGRYSTNVEDFLTLYQGRLRALAMAHDQLFKTDWGGARVDDVVAGTLAAFGPEVSERFDIDVPDTLLRSSETQTLALILNELATNATKHGALSTQDGRVRISAEVRRDDDETDDASRWLHFEWAETGGPPVAAPERSGFGMTFLTRVVQHQHGGSTGLEWLDTGLRYTMRLPLHDKPG